MYFELQLNPGWTDLDIFKITYDEYNAFSRQYMAGQVTSNLLPLPEGMACEELAHPKTLRTT
jgi:hypothetical protein